MHHQTDIGRG
ncbi:hypothetical protein VCHC50A1_1096, partial [Vibrio cholerae HC-50A1]